MDKWLLFVDGLKLLVFGMGLVYVFLLVMIGSMKGLQVLLRPLAEREFAAATAAAAAAARKSAKGNDSNDQLLAAIAVAAVEYKKNH